MTFIPSTIQKCRTRYPVGSRVSLVRANVFQLPFKDESLDLVFHQGLIEHFRNEKPQSILEENLRVLKAHGHLVVDVPQSFHLESICARPFIWTGTWFAGWQTFYSICDLKRLANSLPLENLRYFGMWMNPSFIYRAIRWCLKSWFLLPLSPPSLPWMAKLRKSIRRHFFHHPVALWTGASIGFIGRKKKTF